MIRLLMLSLLAGSAVSAASAPADAFWQRSQASRCSDATSEAERTQLRCWELNAYADPGWPALGLGSYGGGAFYPSAPVPQGQRWQKGGVTRRLG